MDDFEHIQQKNMTICKNTYIQKEQFLEMLQNLNFIAIERADITFITMYRIDCEKDIIEPKGFKLELY